jgi:hypothetical protein
MILGDHIKSNNPTFTQLHDFLLMGKGPEGPVGASIFAGGDTFYIKDIKDKEDYKKSPEKLQSGP